jgi:hypothetical protein
LDKVQLGGRGAEDAEEKPEIDAEIEWDVMKNTMPLDADGGVKVLSEKTGFNENF